MTRSAFLDCDTVCTLADWVGNQAADTAAGSSAAALLETPAGIEERSGQIIALWTWRLYTPYASDEEDVSFSVRCSLAY